MESKMVKLFMLLIVAAIFILANAAPTPPSQKAVEVKQKELDAIRKEAKSDDLNKRAKGIKKVREILERTTPRKVFLDNIKKFNSAEFLSILVDCLENNNSNSSVQARRDAAFALASITAGGPEHRTAVYEAKALPVIIKVLKSEDVENDDALCISVIFVLMSLCTGDYQNSVNTLLIVKNAEVVQRLEKLLRLTKDGNVMRISLSTLFVLFEKIPQEKFDFSWLELHEMKVIETPGQDMNVQAYGIQKACEILKKTDPKEVFLAKIEKFIAAKFLHVFVNFLNYNINNSSVKARTDAAFVLANISASDPKYAGAVYYAGALPIFIKLFESFNIEKELHRSVILGLSNLCGSADRYSGDARAIVNEKVIPRLKKTLGSIKDANALKNTVGILCVIYVTMPKPNFDISNQEIIQIMVKNGAIKNFTAMLQSQPLDEQIVFPRVFTAMEEFLKEPKCKSDEKIKAEIDIFRGEVKKLIKKKEIAVETMKQFVNNSTSDGNSDKNLIDI